MARRKRRSPIVRIILFVINLILICALVFICIIAAKAAFKWGYDNVLDDKGSSTDVSEGNSMEISISADDNIDSIAQALKENKLIKYPILFKAVSRISGNDKEYKSGNHTFDLSMDYQDIMNELKSGKPIQAGPQKNVTTFTIPEGYNIEQIAKLLEEKKLIDKEKFLNAVNEDKYDYAFLDWNEIKNKKGRQYLLEGYLFPNTYEVYVDSTEEEIIKKMLNGFNVKFKDEYYERAKELNMTIDEIVTLASIIEEEAMLDEERPRVSAVFHNRLKSKNYPRLESCATVQYILEERVEVILNKHKEIDSPYNTYMYPGLPVGAIASPGEASLVAALYPKEDSSDLFFVVTESGEHIFSKTFEEHLRAVNQAQ